MELVLGVTYAWGGPQRCRRHGNPPWLCTACVRSAGAAAGFRVLAVPRRLRNPMQVHRLVSFSVPWAQR